MLLAAPDFFVINHRPDLDVLTARWMQLVTLDEMCQGYEALLSAATHYNCRQWLIDTRRRANTDREGASWMISSFLPRLQPTLGGRTALAYLLAPVSLRDPAADAAFPPLSYFNDKPFIAERFIEEGAAITWLQQFRPLPEHA